MLKDKLALIANSAENPRSSCLLGDAMAKMDRETLDAFISAMQSKASAVRIMEVLNEEGISSFGLTHLRDKRIRCFKSSEGCRCIQEAKNV